MGYASKYLKACGQQCAISRTPAVNTYVSLKRSSRGATNPGAREAYWEGLILADTDLASGEIFQINGESYLTLSTRDDPATGELGLLAVKTNAVITHQRYSEEADSNGNIVQEWKDENTVTVFGQIVTASLRQQDPGLLDSARYVFYIAASCGVQKMDRIVYGGENYQVESLDTVALEGVVRMQLGIDTRS